ncbi:MAG: hypothetical protein LBP74_03750 [Treponema sp.]|jgi:hypothetical protein|nr:hypothetical protein [Treponema sp.]
MSIIIYLETLPLNEITKYEAGIPKNGVSFIGYPRQHPSDANKFILIHDPLGDNPKIFEFKREDLLFMENFPSAVTETGEGVPLVKLWIRKGAHGVVLEPFEVDDSPYFSNTNKTKDLREYFLRTDKR